MNFVVTGKAKDVFALLDIKTKKELQDSIVDALKHENDTIAYFQGKTVEQLLKTAELLKLAGKGCFLDLKNAACNWNGSCEFCSKWQEAMAKQAAEIEAAAAEAEAQAQIEQARAEIEAQEMELSEAWAHEHPIDENGQPLDEESCDGQ